jgi:hypothetical protein
MTELQRAIEAELERKDAPQLMLDLGGDEPGKQQRERDLEALRNRLEEIPGEIDRESDYTRPKGNKRVQATRFACAAPRFRTLTASGPACTGTRRSLVLAAGGSSAPGHTGRGRAAAERQAGNCACMAQSPFISAQSFKLGNHKRGRSCDCRRPCTRPGCAGILSLLMEEQGNARLGIESIPIWNNFDRNSDQARLKNDLNCSPVANVQQFGGQSHIPENVKR